MILGRRISTMSALRLCFGNRKKSEESVPRNNASPKKPWINPIWKIRILAVLTICILVVPGNIVTLSIFLSSTTEGTIFKNSQNAGLRPAMLAITVLVRRGFYRLF